MKPLLTEEQIHGGIKRLAGEVNDFYGKRPLTIVGILTGSLMLLADLTRRLKMPVQIGVVQARSYRGAATTPGPLKLDVEMLPELAGRDVLVVDDIFDTGRTLSEVLAVLAQTQPESLRSAVLLNKLTQRQITMTPDHVAFEIPDVFVVGYGLDYNDAMRHLPYIAALEEQDFR